MLKTKDNKKSNFGIGDIYEGIYDLPRTYEETDTEDGADMIRFWKIR